MFIKMLKQTESNFNTRLKLLKKMQSGLLSQPLPEQDKNIKAQIFKKSMLFKRYVNTLLPLLQIIDDSVTIAAT